MGKLSYSGNFSSEYWKNIKENKNKYNYKHKILHNLINVKRMWKNEISYLYHIIQRCEGFIPFLLALVCTDYSFANLKSGKTQISYCIFEKNSISESILLFFIENIWFSRKAFVFCVFFCDIDTYVCTSMYYIWHIHMAYICWSAHFQLGKQSYRRARRQERQRQVASYQ